MPPLRIKVIRSKGESLMEFDFMMFGSYSNSVPSPRIKSIKSIDSDMEEEEQRREEEDRDSYNWGWERITNSLFFFFCCCDVKRDVKLWICHCKHLISNWKIDWTNFHFSSNTFKNFQNCFLFFLFFGKLYNWTEKLQSSLYLKFLLFKFINRLFDLKMNILF